MSGHSIGFGEEIRILVNIIYACFLGILEELVLEVFETVSIIQDTSRALRGKFLLLLESRVAVNHILKVNPPLKFTSSVNFTSMP